MGRNGTIPTNIQYLIHPYNFCPSHAHGGLFSCALTYGIFAMQFPVFDFGLGSQPFIYSLVK